MAKTIPLRTVSPREARINIRVAEDLKDRLAELAEKDGRTLSAYIERILSEHVGAGGPGKRKG